MPALEFARLAFAAIEELEREQYLSREGEIQDLVEEVLPLGVLAKSLEALGRRITIEYLGGNAPCDARLLVAESRTSGEMGSCEVFVEVTSAIAEREDLERESLLRDGTVFEDPWIYRDGSRRRGGDRIVSQPRAQDEGELVVRTSEWIKKALVSKSNRSYADPCYLLIRVQPPRSLSPLEWRTVLGEVQKAAWASSFARVFLVDSEESIVYEV